MTQLVTENTPTFMRGVVVPAVARPSKTCDRGSKLVLGQQHFVSPGTSNRQHGAPK